MPDRQVVVVAPELPQWHHFVSLLLVVYLSAFQGRCSRSAPLLMIFLALPGTILHELAHYTVALLTGGRPANFTIIPRRRDTSALESGGYVWTLGAVTIRNPGVFSSFPSGMAPLLLNYLAWYLYKHWFAWFPSQLIPTLALYLLISILCASSIPSAQDIRVAISSPTGLIFYSTILFFIFRFRDHLAVLLL